MKWAVLPLRVFLSATLLSILYSIHLCAEIRRSTLITTQSRSAASVAKWKALKCAFFLLQLSPSLQTCCCSKRGPWRQGQLLLHVFAFHQENYLNKRAWSIKGRHSLFTDTVWGNEIKTMLDVRKKGKIKQKLNWLCNYRVRLQDNILIWKTSGIRNEEGPFIPCRDSREGGWGPATCWLVGLDSPAFPFFSVIGTITTSDTNLHAKMASKNVDEDTPAGIFRGGLKLLLPGLVSPLGLQKEIIFIKCLLIIFMTVWVTS